MELITIVLGYDNELKHGFKNLCVAFQRINGFEAVYAAGALCGVTRLIKLT